MGIFGFILFHKIKERVCNKTLSKIFMLFSEFYFFQYGKYAYTFCKYSFEKLLQILQTKIKQRTNFKGFETVISSVWLQGKDKTQRYKSNKKTSEKLNNYINKKETKVQTIVLVNIKKCQWNWEENVHNCIDWNEFILGNLTCVEWS